jgi:hypothetical protein
LLHFWDEDFVVEVDNITTRLRSINGIPATHNFRLSSTAFTTSLILIVDLLSGLFPLRANVLNEDAPVNVTVRLRLVPVEFHYVSKCVIVLIRLQKEVH